MRSAARTFPERSTAVSDETLIRIVVTKSHTEMFRAAKSASFREQIFRKVRLSITSNCSARLETAAIDN
jgi:hypothetical protein